MINKIDARGLACPKPVINTKKELEKIQEGLVRVIVDNKIAKENIIKLSKSLKYEYEVILENDNEIQIDIKKGNVIIEEKIESELSDTCIFINSDKMGKGDDELGNILMKGYIYSLTETKPYPKTIFMVNSAVTLTTTNEATIENLSILEKEGVEIQSCGTCLDFYHLKDNLKVGSVTNMYNIVETMEKSKKVITI